MLESSRVNEPALSRRTELLAVGFLAFASIWGGLLTIREPLWIDELHTYWTCSDSFSSVADRARFGNQSPLWFWGNALSFHTLILVGSSPLLQQAALRLPSIVCWFATFTIIGLWLARYAKQSHGSTAMLLTVVLGLSALLICDQLDWFYAVEARPYAAVCLLVIIATLSQQRLFWGPAASQSVLYVLSASTAVYVHYTAIMVVCVLWLCDFLTQVARKKTLHELRARFIDILLVLALCIPAIGGLLSIGRSGHLWNSFAGHIDLATIRSLLPLGCWLGIVALVWALKTRCKSNDSATVFAIQLATTVVVCVTTVWLMGAAGIAPLIHSRYVLGCYPLICLATGVFLLQLNSRPLILCTACAMAFAWMFTQGGPMFIRYGQPIVWQRYEDWPAAVRTVQEQSASGPVRLAFAPMLVETASQESINQYGRENLWYGWDAASILYGSRNTASPDKKVLLTNTVDHWGEELNLETSDSDEILILARTYAPAAEVLLEKQIAAVEGGSFKLQRLFGNAAQRLSVFRIRKIP